MKRRLSLVDLIMIRIDLWRLARVVKRIKRIEARRRVVVLPFSHRRYSEDV